MTNTLLNNMERINVIAEILFDLLVDNPRAQVLTEIIIESSQMEHEQQRNQTSANAKERNHCNCEYL